MRNPATYWETHKCKIYDSIIWIVDRSNRYVFLHKEILLKLLVPLEWYSTPLFLCEQVSIIQIYKFEIVSVVFRQTMIECPGTLRYTMKWSNSQAMKQSHADISTLMFRLSMNNCVKLQSVQTVDTAVNSTSIWPDKKQSVFKHEAMWRIV